MNMKLKQYFPVIRTREEVLHDIETDMKLAEQFYSWKEEERQEFLDFCTGVSKKKEKFTYKDVKNVYTIVLIDKSSGDFHDFQEVYKHNFQQQSDTGLKMNLLQKYVFIPLDLFRSNVQNKGIKNKMDAWLAFLSMDDPDMIIQLITEYPEFKVMYQQAYEICRNVEVLMGIFSEELRIMDRNTVKYMVDQMQEEIDCQKQEIDSQRQKLEQKDNQLNNQKQQIEFLEKELQRLQKSII